MKREIINYPAFLDAINTLFSQTSICDIDTYNNEMIISKQRRKEKIALISAQLKQLKTDIEKYKEQIRQAQEDEDKKKSGLLLNQRLAAKKTLLKPYKEQKNLTPFSELSTDAQTYACTQSLMKKYLLPAFVQSSPAAAILNKDGTVSLNIDNFLNSVLYQQAQHIKDYVASYIERYPTRVNGSRYFIGLHQKAGDFDALLEAADAYFEKINDKNEKNIESILNSHQGLEVIEIYPEHQVQAVRLLTKEALDYEGSQMHHCVATYASNVENGATQIYSIRDYGDDATEFVPHATIEFADGKIKQIKGYRDSIVDWNYVQDTRRFLMSLMQVDDFSTIINSELIPNSEKNNIGIITDMSGKHHDILDIGPSLENIYFDKIRIKSSRLSSINNINIRFKTLEIDGPLYSKTIEQIANLPKVNSLILHLSTQASTLDLSAISCQKLELDILKENNIQEIILSRDVTEIKIKGNLPNLSTLINHDNLQHLSLTGDFSVFSNLNRNKKLQSLSLKGKFPCLTEELFPSTLQELNLCEGLFDRIEKLDLSSFRNLITLDLMNSSFPKLKEIILPGNVKYFSGNHCAFQALERIDISHPPVKGFGTIQTAGHRPFSKDFIRYYGMQFANLPKIKNIQLLHNIEKIHLPGIKFGENIPFAFSEYKNLREINFQFCCIAQNQIIDLSANNKLSTLHCEMQQFSQIIPPQGVSFLDIRKADEAPTPQNWNLEAYPHIKTLQANFLPVVSAFPYSIETLQLTLLSPHEHLKNLKTLDFSDCKRVNLKTSSCIHFSELERIVMPERFSGFHLFQLCPQLTEIDFSHTKGEVKLKEINYEDEVFNDEGQLYLHPQQIEILKKIKIGNDTELTLPQQVEKLPITIELPENAPAEKRQRLKEQYPNLLIVRASNIQTGLQLLKSAKQADGRR